MLCQHPYSLNKFLNRYPWGPLPYQATRVQGLTFTFLEDVDWLQGGGKGAVESGLNQAAFLGHYAWHPVTDLPSRGIQKLCSLVRYRTKKADDEEADLDILVHTVPGGGQEQWRGLENSVL